VHAYTFTCVARITQVYAIQAGLIASFETQPAAETWDTQPAPVDTRIHADAGRHVAQDRYIVQRACVFAYAFFFESDAIGQGVYAADAASGFAEADQDAAADCCLQIKITAAVDVVSNGWLQMSAQDPFADLLQPDAEPDANPDEDVAETSAACPAAHTWHPTRPMPGLNPHHQHGWQTWPPMGPRPDQKHVRPNSGMPPFLGLGVTRVELKAPQPMP
jgi:hypothetical protein